MQRRKIRDAARGKDALVFLGAWARNPLQVGSVFPSSPALGRMMARQIDASRPGHIVEIGGGTGSITNELRAEFGAERVAVIERDPALHRHLQKRFSDLKVILGDGMELVDLLCGAGIDRVCGIVCCVPMLTVPPFVRAGILEQSFAAMGEGGRMVQFTYGVGCPIPKAELKAQGLSARPANVVLFNLPPATVWRFERATNKQG